MVTHSSILSWRISWTEEAGGLQSMGSQRIRHDWATNTPLQVKGNSTPYCGLQTQNCSPLNACSSSSSSQLHSYPGTSAPLPDIRLHCSLMSRVSPCHSSPAQLKSLWKGRSWPKYLKWSPSTEHNPIILIFHSASPFWDIFVGLPISTGVGKPACRPNPANCLLFTAHELMIFTFLNGWSKSKD